MQLCENSVMAMRSSLSVALLGIGLCLSAGAGAQSLIFTDGLETPPACTPPVGMIGSTGEFNVSVGTWPAYNLTTKLWVGSGQYLALHFTASNSIGQYGTFDGSGGFPGDGGGEAIMSISEVPGCFDTTRLGQGCYAGPAPYPGISWITGANGFPCQLRPGASYYLNITFGPLDAGGSCPLGLCGRDFANVQQAIPD